ncbi:MAG: pgsA [Friedmanniella sp.]|nr:pgsA [Friedmanniella sp.]
MSRDPSPQDPQDAGRRAGHGTGRPHPDDRQLGHIDPRLAAPSETHPIVPPVDPETTPWNVPNALTTFRILLVPLFAWMLLAHPGGTGWRLGTTAVFTLAILTDTLDGYLARKHNIVTRFGKLADPIADKALTGMAFLGLSIIGELGWWVTITMLVREWGITLMRFLVLRYGVMAAGRGGKLKTVIQAVAVILYLLPLPGWAHVVAMVVMAVALVITVVTGLDYVRSAVRLRRDALGSR